MFTSSLKVATLVTMDTKQVHGESTCRANECISPKERHNTTIRNCVRFREIENKFNFHKLKMFSKTAEYNTLR